MTNQNKINMTGSQGELEEKKTSKLAEARKKENGQEQMVCPLIGWQDGAILRSKDTVKLSKT